MILYMYIAPEQGLTTPWERNFNVNRNILSLRSFVASLKKISLKSDFIPLFFSFHILSAVNQGQTTTGDKILMSAETSCHLLICVKFQKISLGSLILYIFFHDFIHVYSPGGGGGGQGLKTPWGRNFNVNRNILSFRSFVTSFKRISLKSDFIQFFS